MIGLLYNEPIATGQEHWESSADVMTQVEALERALGTLGHDAIRLPITKDLRRFLDRIEASGVDRIFNLCESIDDDPFFIAHPAALLELLGIPFSGSSAATLQTTTDKCMMKLALQGAGLPTPRFARYDGQEIPEDELLAVPVIAKPQFQDASIGIDQESVVTDPERLPAVLASQYHQYGPLLVEEYIDGREFNVSLFGGREPNVLPIAEIDFSGMPPDLHHIVGYRAKWEPSAIEYHETRRIFPKLEASLTLRLADIARRCYRLFNLRDYGRVDLRMDRNGALFVLEINANPCLSPDAGFPAAVRQAGLDYTAMTAQMIAFLGDRMV